MVLVDIRSACFSGLEGFYLPLGDGPVGVLHCNDIDISGVFNSRGTGREEKRENITE